VAIAVVTVVARMAVVVLVGWRLCAAVGGRRWRFR
jgi:hypothetical protein